MKKLQLDSSESFKDYVTLLINNSSPSGTTPIRIGVPGGRGSKSIIQGIIALDKEVLSRVVLYLIDERLSGETNRETLFLYGLDEAMQKGRFLTTQLIIPRMGAPFIEDGVLDFLFVGVGEDGHFASLFPHSFGRTKDEDIVLVTDSPKPPLERVSISYSALDKYATMSKVFLLFFGEEKKDALLGFLSSDGDIEHLPITFFVHSKYDVTVVTDIEHKGEVR